MEYYEEGRRKAGVVVGFRVTVEEREQLKQMAFEEGISISDVVRRIVRQYLRQKNIKAIY
jgi:transposase-like protein